MDDGAGKRRGARRTRRDGAQATGRPVASKVKRAFTIPAESSRRLDHHAIERGVEPAEVIRELIDRHCRRYVVQDRGASPAGGDAGPAGEG